MLNSYIQDIPYTKLIIVQDSLRKRESDLLKYFCRIHKCRVHYFVFEGNFERTKHSLNDLQNVECHDCASDPREWCSKEMNSTTILNRINSKSGVIVIDSLIHLIYRYDVATIYNLLYNLKAKEGIKRVVTIMHTDMVLLEDTSNYFEHLATLVIELKPLNKHSRLAYTYKKRGGKIVCQIEDYTFVNGLLKCTPIEKANLGIIKETANNIVNTDYLTTFRLSLNDNEKQARSQLVLPYMPKQADNAKPTGEISYKFDDIDDWDEEDPDDDLDI